MDTSTTHEIVRSNWSFFFSGFNRLHEGWLVTVERFDEARGTRTIARDMFFEGILASNGVIMLMVGEKPDRHIAHTIADPEHVLLEEGGVEFGFGEALEIVSSTGAKTFVRFAAQARPAGH